MKTILENQKLNGKALLLNERCPAIQSGNRSTPADARTVQWSGHDHDWACFLFKLQVCCDLLADHDGVQFLVRACAHTVDTYAVHYRDRLEQQHALRLQRLCCSAVSVSSQPGLHSPTRFQRSLEPRTASALDNLPSTTLTRHLPFTNALRHEAECFQMAKIAPRLSLSKHVLSYTHV